MKQISREVYDGHLATAIRFSETPTFEPDVLSVGRLFVEYFRNFKMLGDRPFRYEREFGDFVCRASVHLIGNVHNDGVASFGRSKTWDGVSSDFDRIVVRAFLAKGEETDNVYIDRPDKGAMPYEMIMWSILTGTDPEKSSVVPFWDDDRFPGTPLLYLVHPTVDRVERAVEAYSVFLESLAPDQIKEVRSCYELMRATTLSLGESERTREFKEGVVDRFRKKALTELLRMHRELPDSAKTLVEFVNLPRR